MSALFPVFLKLAGRRVLVVGGGPVAASKLRALIDAGADVTVVAPRIDDGIIGLPVRLQRRRFTASDLDGVAFVVAAATPEANREVAAEADARGIFVNAVDDVRNASAYLGGVVRRDGVTIAISTDGEAPALAGLLREAIDALLPRDLQRWMRRAKEIRREWIAGSVPMSERRPLLLQALVDLYKVRLKPDTTPGRLKPDTTPDRLKPDTTPGTPVALVGAGPGDPELLTQRAIDRLTSADVVLYDALVDPRVLDLAPRARRMFVGKRAGRPAVSQDFINRLLVRTARRGVRVVRLKGGDPFVFGRGGEEGLALAAAGIAFEVVPGISSAIAAPALAGIPVTHRGLASAFVVVSGHAEEAYRPVFDSIAPQSATIVVLMGLSHASAIAAHLTTRGWNPATPAAIVLGASTDAASVEVTTLGRLTDVDAGAPGTIVIGDVVRLRAACAKTPAEPVHQDWITTA
jgi:uroporphyrin-III C-methyltransferase / precorrin-2 dehydrogenase / sirohydrochlorin ferrochelatase